jgi:UDP-2,3-diacylglucosamine pyrophosphatase LpxH
VRHFVLDACVKVRSYSATSARKGGADHLSAKLKIVVSDFHLGAGPPDISVNPLEDFIADEAFAHFLETLRVESDRENKEVELIINGDFFEFLQVPAAAGFDPHQAYPPEAYRASDESSSIKRLDLITAGHPVVFDALSDFIQVETPRRRMTLIKGNHDVNLYWPGVKQRLREALGATGRRASMLLFAERYVSREGIYVEHGHQYAEQINRWDNFDDPRDRQTPEQLRYPAGSRLVIDFFNAIERDRAWADSLKPLTALVWYSLHWDFAFAARMFLTLTRHVPDLGAGINGRVSESLIALCQQLGDSAACRQLSERYYSDIDCRRDFHTRAGQVLVPAASPPGVFMWPPPPDDESALQIARTEIKEIEASMRRVAVRVAKTQSARVIVFGHTHRPLSETLDDHTTWINCGSWHWLGGCDPVHPEVWQPLFANPQQVVPYQRLSYARIDYDEQDQPQAQLLDFGGLRKENSQKEPVGFAHFLARLRRALGGQDSQEGE